MFIYLGLFFNGASWQKRFRNLDPVTETPMYNHLLNLVSECQEQKKIEEKESLKESVVFKKRENVWSPRPKKMS